MSNKGFYQTGDIITLANPGAQYITAVPAGVYIVNLSQNIGFYLKKIEDFVLPSKLYDNIEDKADRIINTFFDRPKQTGVLLEGEKGSGKTMLAKMVSRKLNTMNIPTIIVNAPYNGPDFEAFLESFTQPIMVLFDEYEKVYGEKVKESLLTVLDGVYPSKKLFVLTANNKDAISTSMMNRPGRIYYKISYEGISLSMIKEYCEDNIKNKNHISNIVKAFEFFERITFDMIQAIVEEINRYDCTVEDALSILNISPETYSRYYDYESYVNGQFVYAGSWHGKLFAAGSGLPQVYYKIGKKQAYYQIEISNFLGKRDEEFFFKFNHDKNTVVEVKLYSRYGKNFKWDSTKDSNVFYDNGEDIRELKRQNNKPIITSNDDDDDDLGLEIGTALGVSD